MIVSIQRITPTLRVRAVALDEHTLMLREELRQVGNGRAWCIQGATIVRRLWVLDEAQDGAA